MNNIKMFKFLISIVVILISTPCMSQELIPIRVDSLWGYCDTNKAIKIPAKYKKAYPFRDGIASVKTNKKWNKINSQGEIIFEKYDFVGDFAEGLARVTLNDKEGFINKKGKEVIPLIYNFSSHEVRWGRVWFHSNSKFGMLNKNGDTLSPPKYDMFIVYGQKGFYGVTINNKKGVVNEMGEEIVPVKYNEVGQGFFNGLCDVELNNKRGFVNKKGEEVIPLQYEFVWIFNDGLAVAKKNGKYGFIDTIGNIKVPFIYDNASQLCEQNRYKVVLNSKIGYVDKENNIKIPIKYDSGECFNKNGVTSVSMTLPNKKTGKGQKSYYALIDTTGKELTKFRFDNINTINRKGYNIVTLDNKEGVMNDNGELLTPIIYNNISYMSEGVLSAQLNNQYVYILPNGNLINNNTYDFGARFEDRLAWVQKGELIFYIDKKGREYIY